jgi:hypothetical protein
VDEDAEEDEGRGEDDESSGVNGDGGGICADGGVASGIVEKRIPVETIHESQRCLRWAGSRIPYLQHSFPSH